MTAPEAAGSPSERLATMRMIAGAMAAGVGMLCVVVVIMYVTAQPRPVTEQALSLVKTLSLVNALVAVISYPVSALISKSAENAQAAMVLRLAPREGAALLGCVACLIAAMSGVLKAHPLFWLNLLTAGVFILTTALSLPTEQDLL